MVAGSFLGASFWGRLWGRLVEDGVFGLLQFLILSEGGTGGSLLWCKLLLFPWMCPLGCVLHI